MVCYILFALNVGMLVNNYVGKFSKLCTLDEDYKYCLHGWLRYLKTGRKQYMDYLTEEIEEDSLISQIKEFYNK